jgi:hypothetical protein
MAEIGAEATTAEVSAKVALVKRKRTLSNADYCFCPKCMDRLPFASEVVLVGSR